MNDQPPIIMPNVPGLPNVPHRSGPSGAMVTVLLGAAAALFLVLWIVSLVSGASSNNDVQVAKNQGITEGKSQQSKIDQDKLNALVDQPFKTYSAPAVYGGIEVKYPKTWNAMVTDNPSGTSLVLVLHPDVIKTASDTNFATRLVLTQTLLSNVVQPLQALAKAGSVKASSLTVSGIAANRFDGKWDGNHDGAVTFIPVRDKVIAVYCDDKQYISSYNDIVAGLKINP